MRQRVAIARTLASEPRILLMDEPFAALDEQTRLLLGDKVLQIQQQLRQTTLLITHNITEAVQLSDRVLVMTYRPGRLKRAFEIDLPRSARLRGRRQRQRSATTSRRSGATCARKRAAASRDDESRALQRGRTPMTRARADVRAACSTGARRFITLFGAIALVEGLIRAGVINRFVVPLPSQVLAAIPRIVAEEHVLHRFWQTTQEALWASLLLIVVGVSLGMLLFRFRLLRSACETWVAALAVRADRPDVSAVPGHLRPQRHDHRDDRLRCGTAAGHPQDGRGPGRHARRAARRRPQLSSSTTRSCFERSCCRPRCRAIFVGLRLGLIFMLINIVGVEFLINFGGLGQLINELAERYDLPGTYGAIGFVILVSILFFVACERAERWLLPHAS